MGCMDAKWMNALVTSDAIPYLPQVGRQAIVNAWVVWHEAVDLNTKLSCQLISFDGAFARLDALELP